MLASVDNGYNLTTSTADFGSNHLLPFIGTVLKQACILIFLVFFSGCLDGSAAAWKASLPLTCSRQLDTIKIPSLSLHTLLCS